MKIDFSKPLTDPRSGFPLRDWDDQTQPMTLATVAIKTLWEMDEEDRAMTGVDKVRLYGLSRRIIAGGGAMIDLAVEDVALLKARIGRQFGPLIVGQAWAMLDG